MGSLKPESKLDLKVGDWVEVRSHEEIMATLDERGCYENVPFMPEMLQFCGQKLRVYKRADKTCDNIVPWGIRRMKDSVHLEIIRCDGTSHGGCQAGCLTFWKEIWLKRTANAKDVVPANALQPNAKISISDKFVTVDALLAATQKVNKQGEIIYSCQATEMRNYTSEMRWWDPRQYIRDVRSGNISDIYAGNSKVERRVNLVLSVMVAIRGIFFSVIREKIGISYPFIRGNQQQKTPLEVLDLQPGELVQVRSKEEIIATLDQNNRNRGLLFDCEMLPFCGGIYRVLRRVNNIIDEKTGKMMDMKNPCIILEGVFCKSDYHRFCPKAIYAYWRENWLRRIPANTPPDSHCDEQKMETCSQVRN